MVRLNIYGIYHICGICFFPCMCVLVLCRTQRLMLLSHLIWYRIFHLNIVEVDTCIAWAPNLFAKTSRSVLMTVKGKKRSQRQKTILKRLIYSIPTTLIGQNLHVALRTDTCTNKYFVTDNNEFNYSAYSYYLLGQDKTRPSATPTRNAGAFSGTQGVHSTIHLPPQKLDKKARFRVAISVQGTPVCYCK